MKTQVFMFCCLLMLSGSLALGQNYIMQAFVVGAGGGKSTSPSFSADNIFGEPLAGRDSSANYDMGLGFWYQVEAIRSFYSTTNIVDDGWNMLSVARTTSDYRKINLYPTAISKAFIYEGSYKSKDTLKNGPGYWLKFSGAQAISVSGSPRTTDTIIVADKWNMIGSIVNPVQTSSISSIPPNIVTSLYFGYDNVYNSTTTIEPGQAYWVKTNGGGKLVLNAPTAAPNSAPDQAEALLSELNVLTVEGQVKGKNIRRELLFGSENGKQISLDRYEMPPRPPKGALDVRFTSNRFVELLPSTEDEPKEISLSLQFDGEPLKLTLTQKEDNGYRYTLVEKIGKKIVAQHRLSAQKPVIVSPTEEKNYVLKANQVPMQYRLYQNYPNPFNPVTVIRYQMPVPSKVTLRIYDILGREVANLVDEIQEEGFMSVEWNTLNSDGRMVASGVYFYRLEAISISEAGRSFRETSKMLLLR